MATKAKPKAAAKKTPAKKSTAKRSHSKKPETTPAQDQTLSTLKADAQFYGHTDSTTTHEGPNVVFEVSGRRWVVDVQGHVTT